MFSNNGRYGFPFFLAVAALFFISCGQESGKEAGHPAGSAARVEARTVIKYARGFRIDYYDRYRDVSIVHLNNGKTDTLHYLLVEQGVEPPHRMKLRHPARKQRQGGRVEREAAICH